MSVSDYNSKCIPFTTEGILQEVNDSFSNYRSRIKTKAFTLMKDYDNLIEVEGSDVPETFFDRESGTCCAIFSGTDHDLDMIEEYIKTRSVYR